ncbi:MAG: hypothetical protein IVZ94_08130 [Nitrospirae bacterium]|nr:hypothetical protein [Nitrospirota bacterium]
MKKSILEIYALAVCFATVVCFVIVSGIAIYNVIEIISPEFTLSAHEYTRHQSNDAFWKSCNNKYDTEKKEKKRPPDEELTKQRMESYQQALKSENRNAIQSLTKTVIVIILDIIFFIAHWRIARRAREANMVT